MVMIDGKHEQHVSFIEGKQIVENYMKGPYEKITHKLTIIYTREPDKYRGLIVKLLHLGSYDWPKFQNYLKSIYSKEILQTGPQKKSIETIERIKKKKYKIFCSNTNTSFKKIRSLL